MLRKNPHPALLQGVEDGFRERLLTKLSPNFWMREDVDRATDTGRWKLFRTKARGFALVNNGYGLSAGRISNRRRLTVIQRLDSRPDGKPFEMGRR